VLGKTPAQGFGSFYCANSMVKYKYSFHWGVFLAKARITPFRLIEWVIIDSDYSMQSNCMPCCHWQGPVLEWTERIDDIVQHGSFTPFCKRWPVLTLFWILELLVSELLWLGGLLGHLLFSIPLCLTSIVGCTVITNWDLWQEMNCFRPPAASITNTTNYCHYMELSVKTLKMS
jgi:hypothetical protein